MEKFLVARLARVELELKRPEDRRARRDNKNREHNAVKPVRRAVCIRLNVGVVSVLSSFIEMCALL